MNLPTAEQLAELRKGLRRRKKPEIFAGMHWAAPGIGIIQVQGAGDDFRVEWQWCGGPSQHTRKHGLWRTLCISDEFELERFELGTLADLILQAHAKQISDSIGHPMVAYREAGPYLDSAARWRHWGRVRAGHML